MDLTDPIAVILAAGRGVRMGGERPKTLIPMGSREPLLHYILRGLALAGVDDVAIVTGFQPQEIADFVRQRNDPVTVGYVHNDRWNEVGNYHSLRVGLEAHPERDVLVVNCDVIVSPRVYGAVAGTQGDLVLALQRRDDLDEEDMRVSVENDRVLGVSKGLDLDLSVGEYAGVSLVTPRCAKEYVDYCNDLEQRGETSGYYEDVYDAILDPLETAVAEVGLGEYAEVDEPVDVDDALAVIEATPDLWDER